MPINANHYIKSHKICQTKNLINRWIRINYCCRIWIHKSPLGSKQPKSLNTARHQKHRWAISVSCIPWQGLVHWNKRPGLHLYANCCHAIDRLLYCFISPLLFNLVGHFCSYNFLTKRHPIVLAESMDIIFIFLILLLWCHVATCQFKSRYQIPKFTSSSIHQ